MERFRTRQSNLTTFLIVNGRLATIQFSTRGTSDDYGYYTAYNPAIGAALRKHPQYGSLFELEQEEKHIETVIIPPSAVYEKVKNTQQAQKILVEVYNIDKSKINSKSDAQRFAKELNISFPNL